MKKRGDSLEKHFAQAKAYWDNTYSNRTQYVILCNFDEFWVYNWNLQKDPLDKVPLSKLTEMWRSLAFLCPEKITPIFTNNYVEVTKEATELSDLRECNACGGESSLQILMLRET